MMEVLGHRNNNNPYEKDGETDTNGVKTSPVLPTVRRVGGGHKTKTNQWQDFIDREQNSVDHLIQNSFATLRKDLKVDPALLQIGSSKTISGYRHQRRKSPQGVEPDLELRINNTTNNMNKFSNNRQSPPNNKTSTLPRSPAKRLSSLFNLGHSEASTKWDAGELDVASVAPSGIEELEMMYAPMKNLSRQLPNANLPSFNTSIDDKMIQMPLLADRMPRPHPLRSISSPTGYTNGDNEQRGGWKDLQIVEDDPLTGQRSERLFTRDDDQESIISAMADIPPPLAPIQSHAVLRESLSHQPSPFSQPRSNGAPLSQMRQQKPFPILSRSATLGGESCWGKTPPLPPRRTNSKLSLLSPTVRENLLQSSPFNGIYANTRALNGLPPMGSNTLNRTSLMSTGSSEEGTSSGSASSGESSHISSSNEQAIEVGSCTNSTTVGSPRTPMTPHSMNGGDVFFSTWAAGSANYPWNSSGASATSSHSPSVGTCITEMEMSNFRSVSQIGEPPDSSITGDASHSDISGSGTTRIYSRHTSVSGPRSAIYAKINRESNNNLNNLSDGVAQSLKKESDYISILYNAVQRQGGNGSVESAMSPYLKMMKCNNGPKKGSSPKNVISSNNLSQKEQEIYDLPETTPKRQSVRHRNTSLIRSSTRRSRSQSHVNNDVDFQELWREVEQKRRYRIGLNLFNGPKPDLGIEYLSRHGFLELSHLAVARFLFKRSNSDETGDGGGLAKQKVGEYLGNLQSPFAMKVLSCFVKELDLTGQRVDKSLRNLLSHVRVPGEAQKIERIMEEFGRHYYSCNSKKSHSTNLGQTNCGMNVSKLKSPDSIITLAFAIMMLNTDLHTPNIKVEKKMTVDDFVKNLGGVDGGKDFDGKLLRSIYKAIKKQQFIGGADHVAQTLHLQQRIVQSSSASSGKRILAPPPNLAEPHRRLVCLCRLYEVMDINADVSPGEGEHYRDIILFNDLLVVTKEQSSVSVSSSTNKKKHGPTYAYKDSFHLRGLELTLFHTNVYRHGIQIIRKSSGCVLLTLNASSEHDRYKFVMDLQESIYEMNQMEEAISEMTASGQ